MTTRTIGLRRRLAAIAATTSVLASLGAAPIVAAATPTDLFISEYVEGSGNTKAIEVFNGTGSAVNLATLDYEIVVYFNSSIIPGLALHLTGTVASGDVHLVVYNAADPELLAQADQTMGTPIFNGDDLILLRKSGSVIVDSIGQSGTAPSGGWGTDPTNTMDNTLRRLSSITAGDTNPSDPFDPATEWQGFDTDTVGGLGSHTVDGLGGGSDTGVVDVDFDVTPSGACLELSTSSASFGSILLGEESIVAEPQVTVTNCSPADESLLVRGSDAVGTGVTWQLTGGFESCATTLGIDRYRLELLPVGVPQAIQLSTTNQAAGTLTSGQDKDYGLAMWAACPGSSGAGQTMSLQVSFLAIED